MGIIKNWHDLNALEIIRHPWFISAFFAGGLAQLIKLVRLWHHTGRIDLARLRGAGCQTTQISRSGACEHSFGGRRRK